LTMGAHNCDGWSTSGGPWITPEMSMKTIVWSKTLLKGGKSVDTMLLKPSGKMGYCEDVAVIACRKNETPNSYQLAYPRVLFHQSEVNSLNDGSPVSGIRLEQNESISIEFPVSFLAEKLVIHPRVVFSWGNIDDITCDLTLSSSKDGRNFKPVKSFRINGANRNHEVSIPSTRARYFLLKLDDSSQRSLEITELALLGSGENPLYNPSIVHHMDKIVSSKPSGEASMFESNAQNESRGVIKANIVDVTRYLSTDGRFHWEVPEGSWEIIRFGYTTTGVTNAPATRAGTGLECDKMDTAALNLHFESFPAKLIETAGSLAGNTFSYLFIDSWECGYQNWTRHFPEEFEKRRGYSILPWIPALAGEVIQDSRTTEAFLHDFRLTIGELIEAYYYEHFARLCHSNDIELHAEVIYGGENYPPLKVLETNQYVDLPMFEFWTSPGPDGMVVNHPVENTGYVTSAQAAHLYNKYVIPAEAYTGYAYYSEAPWDLKPFGDRAFSRGINRMVLHSYVHQPSDKTPGMTLGMFGNHFNRHNAWWPHISGWTTFQARVQYLLQQGKPVSDILYLVGDRMPQYQPETPLYEVPPGIKAQLGNRDVLARAALTEKNSILLNGDQVFQILVLPDDSVMDLVTLQQIARLVDNGATLFGPPPSTTLSLDKKDEQTAALRDLAVEIWGDAGMNQKIDHTYGKGRAIWGGSLVSLIRELDIQPDFEWASGDSAKLIYIHKKTETADIYYVTNQEDRTVGTECIFRIAGKKPETWDPRYGTRRETALFRIEEGRTRIPVTFGPKASFLFVFEQEVPREYVNSLSSGGERLFPEENPKEIPQGMPEINYAESGFTLISEKERNYTLETNSGLSGQVQSGGTKIFQIRDNEMELNFGGDVGEQKISELGSWTEFDEPEMKYFSGRAVYTIGFDLPGEWGGAEEEVYLSLGKVEVTAEVKLNGEPIGTVWMPDYRIPVSGYLKEGENLLEVEVANVYRNRIIGDLREYGEMRNIWTTSPVDDFFNTGMELRKSGLLGPVRLLKQDRVLVSFQE